MTMLAVLLVVVFAIGAAIGIYAWFAPRMVRVRPASTIEEPAPPPPPYQPNLSWTAEAGEEFAGLAESARCDLIFAVADLRDERSERLLVHALDDPSDAVALAAAHVLARRGQAESVTAYAQRHPGDRAERIVETLALLEQP